VDTPHDGRQNRYPSEGIAGTEELAGAGEGTAETRYEGTYRGGSAEPGHPEEPVGHDAAGPPADPGPGPSYGWAPEPPAADPGPAPPYQSPPPGGWQPAHAEPPGAEPAGGPLPADRMPGFGQPYPGADIPPPPDRDFGGPGGDAGSHSDFGPHQQQFTYWAEQSSQQQDTRRPYQDGAHSPGRPFEGAAEPGYGQPAFQQGATAEMPPAPPDVPVAGSMQIPPLSGQHAHTEAQPSDHAGPSARSFSAAAGSGESPTLAGAPPVPGARPGEGPGRSARTARAPRPRVQAPGRDGAPGRSAQVTLSRVEPWSVMRFSFVISLVAFIILFVATALLYAILAGLGVFDSLQNTIASLTSGQGSSGLNAAQWFSASRILGYAAIVGAVNIFLITALSTVGAVLYNAASRLIGGVEVTLDETE
jgi:Transmembrane domain of unknown function (DUF3566)